MAQRKRTWTVTRRGRPRPPAEDSNSRFDFSDWADRIVRYAKPRGRRA